MSLPVDALNGHSTWSTAIRISVLSLLMLITLLGNVLTLIGNVVVIITIVSCAELRKKRVNIFILNLAVGDLIVCFVAMPRYLLLRGASFGQWKLGTVACKISAYAHVVSVSVTILLLTVISIERYQVRLITLPILRIYCSVYLLRVNTTKIHCVSKNMPDIFDCNLKTNY